MANVALDGTDGKGIRLGVVRSKNSPETLNFARIASLCAGSVCLYNADRCSIDICLAQKPLEQINLCSTVRVRDGVRVAALVGHDISDDAVYTIVLGNGIRQPLKHKEHATLSSAVPVGTRIEWLASACRAEEVASRQS